MIRNPLLLAASDRRYLINQSLRFRASNSAFLTRTPGAASNQRTWTFSAWVKRGIIGTQQTLLAAGTTNRFAIFLDASSTQLSVDGGGSVQRASNALFRDPNAHGHLLVVLNTPDATAQNRLRVYWNGVEITSWATNNTISLNQQFDINSAVAHEIGRDPNTSSRYFDGYLSEVHFVDGQALTPSSFGRTDPTTGAWVPIRYTGTYGANGFYLPFNDATSTTTISQDRSGNGNNWTSSGISVTSGVTFDQMLDTPTNNFAVVNAIGTRVTTTSSVTLDNANMRVSTTAAAFSNSYWPLTITPQGGAYHIETTWSGTLVGNGNAAVCLWRSDTIQSGVGDINYFPSAVGVLYASNGTRIINGSSASYGATWTAGDRITMEWNTATGDVTFFKNGVSQGVISNAIPPGVFYTPVIYTFNNGDPRTPSFTLNCGQQPFADTPTTGFVALNTANLPTPTIQNGATGFQATLRTGTGAAASVSSLAFQPDLVWIKSRSNATNHNLFDAVRGVNNGLVSNSTAAEYADANSLTAFNSNGYSLGTDGSSRGVNINTNTYVDWAWREGAAYGFDIVTYTGTGSARTVAHSLNAVPHMMIVKPRGGTVANGWRVYHRSLANTQYLQLNTTAAADTYNDWNNTTPTSSVFSVNGTPAQTTNENGTNYVAYLWTSIPGFSLFGSYTGNGSADGPFVWCGFRPRFVMAKRVDTTGAWAVNDAARDTFNVVDDLLNANTSGAETTFAALDITANGFKLRNTDSGYNASGGTYVFAAFAETPFKFANGR